MTTARSILSRNCWAMLASATLVLTSCAAQNPTEIDNDGANAASSSPTNNATATDDAELIAEVDAPVSFEVCQEAEQIDGATVEWLDDVVIEEQRLEGADAQTVDFDGEQVEIPGAPDIIVPERVGQAGCIIEYPAPGGCLPAVEISGAFIPGYRVPDRKLESVELPDGTVLEEVIQEGFEVEPVQEDSVRAEQVCQTEPEDAEAGELVSHVLRPHIMRPWISSTWKKSDRASRAAVTTESGVRIPSMNLSGYTTPTTVVGSALVPQDMLKQYRVEGSDHTEFAERNEVTAYTTEGDVLFDSDDHELRPDATAELQTIADDIADRSDDVTITVEGHTDNLPSQQYTDNTELSERRAESVLQWLTEHTDLAAEDMSAAGLGDEHPRASNSSDDGRQQNRRVVITITPKDYDPSIEYEMDDSQAATQ